ncbi:hypothetical protein OG948_55185 (plasmid) [Embleya sp. NBC_00888]|uniref:hypothetical protein n=1 Tax=Embleya sp. NBC_00888 TaxID=2975960 RepID=UPI003863D2D3|nr:hypothetical protein OG948_55185 [Embleya sp. NBC_00888]
MTVELVDPPAQPPFRWRAGLPGSEPAVVGGIPRVHTDEGLVGEAHTRRGLIVADLVARRTREDLRGRDPIGGDVPLMYDGSAGFDLADSIRLGHVLSEAGYLWYEEPMREFSVTAPGAGAGADDHLVRPELPPVPDGRPRIGPDPDRIAGRARRRRQGEQ